MQEMPSLNTPVQRLTVAILPMDLHCSGPLTHSEEILTTGKSHGKKPDRFFPKNILNAFLLKYSKQASSGAGGPNILSNKRG